jgi:hypothetical protein
MRQVESLLVDAKEDDERSDAQKLLTEPDHLDLYRIAVKNAPLLRLMQSKPSFSEAKPFEIATLARLADVRPHAGGSTITANNPFFMRILTSVETTTPRKLLTDDFTKLVHFDQYYHDICQMLFEIAETDKWASQLRAIEIELAPQSINTAASSNLSPKAVELRDLLLNHQESDDPSGQTAYKLFLNPPLFSAMLADEVQLYFKIRGSKPAAGELLADLFDSAVPIEKSRRIAVATVELLLEDDKFKELELSIALQQKAASYFLELRKFAKVDALNYKWRVLAQQLRLYGIGPLKALEGEALKPAPSLQALPASWAPYLQDTQLLRFLGLRPLFKDFYKQEFDDYFAAAQVVKAEDVTSPGASALPAVASLAAVESVPIFENVYISITVVPSEPIGTYQVSIRHDGQTVDGPGERIVIADEAFEALRPLTPESFQFRGFQPSLPTREGGDAQQLGSIDLNEYLTNAGARLFDLIFTNPQMRASVIDMMKDSPHLRIVLELEDPKLTALPWENLYIPELGMFPSLIGKYSMIRFFRTAVSLFPRTLTPPLRILVVVASPNDAPPLNVQQEQETMSRTLAASVQSGQVKVEFTKTGTLEEVQRALRLFAPHLFHFVGHGVYTTEHREECFYSRTPTRNPGSWRHQLSRTF